MNFNLFKRRNSCKIGPLINQFLQGPDTKFGVWYIYRLERIN